MLVHAVTIQVSCGAALWIYVPECSNDTQIGFIFFFHYMNAIEISGLTESMIYSWKPEGTFLFYSILNFLAFLFFYKFMKESKGLTDK